MKSLNDKVLRVCRGVLHTPELRGLGYVAVKVSLHLCGALHAVMYRAYAIRPYGGAIRWVIVLYVLV